MSGNLFRKKSIDLIMRNRKAGFSDAEHAEDGLKRVSNVRNLTLMGIVAVIGAGIFSTIGNASFNGGLTLVGMHNSS